MILMVAMITFDSDGNEIATATTDVDGAYLFDELPLGTYTVMIDTTTLPDLKQDNPAYDPDGGDDNMATVTLDEANPDNSDQDFAYVADPIFGSIGDYVWQDDNGDGLQNEPAENGVNDVTVNLLDKAGNVLDTTSTTDDADGNPGSYLFDGLAVNTSYVVEFVLPDGFSFTVQDNDPTPLIDSESTEDSDADPETGRTAEITLQAPIFTTLTLPDQPNWDAGIVVKEEQLGSIGDQVWSDDDNDGNGIVDGDDVPLFGITVKLLDSDGNEVATASTGLNGDYLFENLPLGTYTIMIDESTLPDQKQGNPAYDPDGGDDSMSIVTLDADNPDNLDQDFAYVAPAPDLGSIGDQIWSDDDMDGNGTVDGDDMPLADVVVKLLDSAGEHIATDITDADGRYLFENLPLGTYTVVVDDRTLLDAKRGNPAYDPDGGGDNMSTVTIDETTPDNLDQDFAYSNVVPEDDDNDGLSNIEEATLGTNPNDPDTDNDGLTDGEEVNDVQTNPLDPDTDDGGVLDSAEVNEGTNPLDSTDDNTGNDEDRDGDGLTNMEEEALGTDPDNPDSDNDGLPDGVEVNAVGTDPLDPDTDNDELTDGAEINQFNTDPLDLDTDNDALLDGQEPALGTDPTDPDTDNDGVLDGPEVAKGTDPLVANIGEAPVGPSTEEDSDGDGLSNEDEVTLGTDPDNPDSDNDTLLDGNEIRLYGTDPLNLDSDSDKLNDSLEIFTYNTDPNNSDTDNDGLLDGKELLVNLTNPRDADTDAGGVIDGAEVNNGTDPLDRTDDAAEEAPDQDQDNLSDDEENVVGTQPDNPDSDDDGLNDAEEVQVYATDPSDPDSDNDGLDDFQETQVEGTDPNNPDSDSDGLQDGDEVGTHNTDPLNADSDDGGIIDGSEVTQGTDPLDGSDDVQDGTDSDEDGLTDEEEQATGTDMTNPDTDGDNIDDGTEVNDTGTDPGDPDSDNDGTPDGEDPVDEPPATEAGVDGPVIMVSTHTVAPDDEVTVSLNGFALAGLATATIEVVYDPAILEVVQCLPDPTRMFDLVQCNAAFSADRVRFNVTALTGVSGDVLVADVVFRAIGVNGDRSDVQLNLATVADAQGIDIMPMVVEGYVMISSERTGDVNCDGDRNAIDSLLTLQHDVGIRDGSDSCTEPQRSKSILLEPSCDVTGDGKCNSIDALFTLQCDVGIENPSCPADN